MGHSTTSMEGRLSDVALARSLVIEIAAHRWRGVEDLIERVYAVVSKINPAWSRRRIRAIWNTEAASIKFHEMCELQKAAELTKEQQEQIARVRHDHKEFIRKATSLISLLEHQDADFHRDQIQQLGNHVR